MEVSDEQAKEDRPSGVETQEDRGSGQALAATHPTVAGAETRPSDVRPDSGDQISCKPTKDDPTSARVLMVGKSVVLL